MRLAGCALQVKKELPDATDRFAKIDKDVKGVLSKFKAKKNCVECCNQVCVGVITRVQNTSRVCCPSSKPRTVWSAATRCVGVGLCMCCMRVRLVVGMGVRVLFEIF